MRRLHVAALFGIILTLALLVWNGIGRRNDAVGSPVRATQAAAPSRDFGAVPVNTVSAAPSAYVAPRNAGDLPAAREKQRIFAKAKVLKERATPPDGQGRFTKTRLVEAEGKYPFLRVEEVWQKGAAGEEVLVDEKAMVADHFVVRVREKTARTELETFLTGFGGSIRRAIPNSDLYLVKTPAVSLDVYELTLARLRQAGPLLKYAEPDYVVHALMTPNDPSFGLLWGLHNVGQTSGTGDADIDAPEAWDVTRGSAAVVVGIIDTGIDYTHPDLAANSWVNTAEIPGNGIDDDGNGYVDDVRGWDFVNNDNDPMDDHYHGTHCAGTIGAVGNNGIGVVGVCHTVKLMALKFLSSSGSGYNSDAVEAVAYATANGATLTSNSWGGGGYSQALKDAIDAAGAAGKLFVAAAGNNSQDTDSVAFYPSCYSSPNIIAVAATDHNDALASFSNYGATPQPGVHLQALTSDILPLVPIPLRKVPLY
jgi:subtilisin family serine protease